MEVNIVTLVCIIVSVFCSIELIYHGIRRLIFGDANDLQLKLAGYSTISMNLTVWIFKVLGNAEPMTVPHSSIILICCSLFYLIITIIRFFVWYKTGYDSED